MRLALPPLPKKGLITDLDETLWAGVLGDDGPEGISWDLDRKTQFHALYQQVLNTLGSSGVLIGVASKNDEALVRKALERPDLVVNPQHLFPIEAHWRPKVEGTDWRTLDAWNIAADSVVFIDDNPLELEQVKAEFPQMECLAFRMDDPHSSIFATALANAPFVTKTFCVLRACVLPATPCGSPPLGMAPRLIDCSRALRPRSCFAGPSSRPTPER